MLDASGTVIYVGKAKNLKKRVSSYFQRQLDTKTLQMVRQIKTIEVTLTRNEREALLLESNLIKELKPKYNIIFRDDKSYPYLYLTTEEPFPQLMFYRGHKDLPGKYFGPYPSASLAREALSFLQSLFKLRQCDNGFFKTRKRPCLQYQINRCTAPCVGYVDEAQYQIQVKKTLQFLEGKSQFVLKELIEEMEVASLQKNYERAAMLRDQIALLRKVQEQQIILKSEHLNVDVLALMQEEKEVSIHLLVIREGRMLGSRNYFSNLEAVLEGILSPEEELLASFILQHYIGHENGLPTELIVSQPIQNKTNLEKILKEQTNQKLTLTDHPRGVRQQWVDMAKHNARVALQNQLSKQSRYELRFAALQEALHLELLPQRLECFDVSHTSGLATVASCVVFDVNGPLKSAYRRFNVKPESGGDDYAALKEALTRRYTRLKTENGTLPDILIIDGGKGQLTQAEWVLRELQVPGVVLIAVAKGPGRKAGLETLYLSSSKEPFKLSEDSPALHLIQSVRDEAHRFAITTHRKQRGKRSLRSRLEEIPGVGKARRMALLKQMGGLQEIQAASIEELAKVPGISRALAERIYESLHGNPRS